MDIPVISSFMGPNMGGSARRFLNDSNIAVVNYPEQAAVVMKKMLEERVVSDEISEKQGIASKNLTALKDEVSRNSGKYLDERTCTSILKEYGIETVKSIVLRNIEEVENIDFAFPIVAKIDNDKIIHKSDVGGVILNIENKHDLIEVFKNLINKFPESNGILVQEQVEKDVEVIVGAIKDKNVGHSLMVGAGGVMVELYKDVSFTFIPSTKLEIKNSIKNLKFYPILEGFRGEKGVNLEDLSENMEKLNKLILDFPEIKEIDINPLIYQRKTDKFVAVDCRIRVE